MHFPLLIAVVFCICNGVVTSLPSPAERSPPHGAGPEMGMEVILRHNQGLHLFQGDIAGVDPNSRNAILNSDIWPGGVIPYVISSEYNVDCADEHENCAYWAGIGECVTTPIYMNTKCRLSCGVCQADPAYATCNDTDVNCAYWAGEGECTNPQYQEFMSDSCPWSCGVCHVPIARGSEAGLIMDGIKEFNTRTCVHFVPRTSNDQDYVLIRKLDGCHSQVGRMGGLQDLSLRTDCLRSGTIVHELMHAVGFWHEHSRPDRDQWVTIHLHNAQQDQWHAFDKHSESRTLGLPYDYSSVMHYDSHAFSMNGRETITAKRALNGAVLGWWTDAGLNDLDVEKVNTLYGCSTTRQ
ncbi:astacin-like isoform X1 [Branchiostoma lanceolatum]|uniref:astacin-like isoform X1 n=2 Tax=Branchiostoma lanceolatum TaxID=7740 RepID=UPI0034551739